MTKTTTRIACAVASLALVGLAGCGDDSSSGSGAGDLSAEEQEYVDAMMTSLQADDTAPFTDEEGKCLAEGMITTIGVDTLKEAGITPESIGSDGDVTFPNLAEDKSAKLVDLFFDGDCFDFGSLMATAIAQDPSVSIPIDKAECIGDKIADSDGFKEAFIASVTGDDSADPFSSVGDIFQIFADCDVDLADLGG
ncbi:MAG: hypothetical protein RL238_2863 [Actinomycetota bacterium]|jgi:hypothetical protein